MNWTKSEVKSLIEMLDDDCSLADMYSILKKPPSAIQCKIRHVKKKREEMNVHGITEQILILKIRKNRGSLKLIAEELDISYQCCKGFINAYPKITNIYEQTMLENADHLRKLLAAGKRASKVLRQVTAVSRVPLVRMNPSEAYNATTPIQRAQRVLGSRLGTHPKLGLTLDGHPIRIYQMMEAASIRIIGLDF